MIDEEGGKPYESFDNVVVGPIFYRRNGSFIPIYFSLHKIISLTTFWGGLNHNYFDHSLDYLSGHLLTCITKSDLDIGE